MKSLIKKLFRENVEKFETIELSCAALANIEIDSKFLLFKEKEKYQPIGGGLKYLDSALPFLKSIDFEPTRTDKDIRMFIPKKNWDIFSKWFKKGIDRETTIDREVNEELKPYLGEKYTNKLNTHAFVFKEIITDKYRIFQIHKVTFPDEVKKAILDLVAKNKSFILATTEEINNESNGISSHSKYIF